jgi:ankyrin repeat protein
VSSTLVEEHVPAFKQPLIRITPDLSKVPRRVPQNPSGSNNKALQKILLTAISAHKHTIVEQLLNRGVSPNTDPAQNSLIEAAYGKDLTILRLLLEFGGDPNIKAADGNTPLRVACQHGHEEEVKLLLEYGASPNGLTPVWTSLAWALDGCYEVIIRLLLQYGTDPNAKMQNGETTLLYACGKRHQGISKMIQEIIEYGADVNGKNSNGKTALYYACENNRPDLVQLFLSSGADPNLPGPNLPIEASYRHPECMKLLISSGADVHAKKEFMEKAVWQNCIEVVQQFLDAGIDPNSKTNDYWSPLTTAIRDNHGEIMALLLSRGADPNLKGEDFPLMMAVDKPDLLKHLISAGADIRECKGLLEKAVYRDQEGSIRILLEVGEPIDGVEGDYYRPVCTAVRDNRPELLSLLLSKGADPNLVGGEGVPLMIAANKPQMLQQLLKAGADPKKAKGVLEKAVYLNCIEAIPILLDAGVDINGGKDDYYRPLTTAVRDQHLDILALLLEKGADPDLASGEGKPLIVAANKPAMIKQLLAGGADVKKDLGGLMEKAVYLNSIESLPILAEAGAYINGGKDDFYRPLNTAVRDNRVDHLKKLLELGADPNVAGGEGIPLTMAARQEDGTSLQILLDGGAEVDKTHNAWTALMCACERNLPENVKMLMRRGADVNVLNGSGNSAMDIAANAGHDDIVMMLLEVL